MKNLLFAILAVFALMILSIISIGAILECSKRHAVEKTL
jgi:hypothetical protein